MFNVLQYLWCRDAHLYECERYRVQFALLFQIFTYTCCRPGAVVESTCHPNSNEVLTYGVSQYFFSSCFFWSVADGNQDVKLSIVGEEHIVMVEITFRYVKNRGQGEPLRATLMENVKDYGYGLCPITLLLALAFADNAFEGDTTPAEFFAMKASSKGIRHLRWKSSARSQPIFRQKVPGGDKSLSPERGLRYGVLRPHMSSIVRRAGFEEDFRPYDIRRGTANITDGKMSAARHRQMMGHTRPETFERNYISRTILADVQSLSQNEPERLDLIRTLMGSSSRRDVGAPIRLPAEEVAEVDQSEELKDFDKELLTADHDTAIRIASAKQWKRETLLKARLKSYRKDWFEKQDDQAGRASTDPFDLDIPSHGVEVERRRTATALFGSVDHNNQTALVEDLVKICLHTTSSSQTNQATRKPPKTSQEKRFSPGSEPLNGNCRFCNSALSSLDQEHQVAHVSQCFSKQQNQNRNMLDRIQQCEWGLCNRYFPPVSDGPIQQSEKAVHFRTHIRHSDLVCRWSQGRCGLRFCSMWKLREHMKTAHNVVDSVKSMSPKLCCSKAHLCEFSWEDHCSGHLETLEDFICAPSDSRPGWCPFCLGNEGLQFSRRCAPFKSLLRLQSHIKKQHPSPSDAHFRTCPHPFCQQDLYSNDQLQEHFQDVHGVALQKTSRQELKRTRRAGTSDEVPSKRTKISTDVLAYTENPTDGALDEDDLPDIER